MAATGVLVTGFGGPENLESVRPFMCNLMGREPSDELVDRVCRRYLAIGGSSPLPEIARAFAEQLRSELSKFGHEVPVEVGMLYWRPFIADGLARLKAAGCNRVVLVSLSPFESKVAHGATREAIEREVAQLGGMEVVEAPLISETDEFAEFYAGATAATLEDVDNNEGLVLAFTAHSLPESDLTDDDPYVRGLQQTANRVASKLGLEDGAEGAGGPALPDFSAFGLGEAPRAWYLVYQSKGAKPGAWLGPDMDELIDAVAASEATGIVAVPIGFVTDHMETRYDLDIAAAGKAFDADIDFFRVPVINEDEAVAAAVAAMVSPLIES